MSTRAKFVFSLAAFGALALLSWNTMSEVPIPVHSAQLGIDFSIDFRMVTVAILGLLATRTAFAYWRAKTEQQAEAESEEK